MNPIRHLRHVAGVLAGLACAWLGLAIAAPAALASGRKPSPPTWDHKPIPLPPGHIHRPVHQVPVPVHTAVIGGMPGWQIALIAIGAALLAATTAVLVDRARAARRKPATAAA
jgi:hypothetical protein